LLGFCFLAMALMSFQAVVPMNTRGQLLISASGR
jgi:hypothetical protein